MKETPAKVHLEAILQRFLKDMMMALPNYWQNVSCFETVSFILYRFVVCG